MTTQRVHVESVREVSPEATGAWREGRLYYEEANLVEVIDDAHRYYDGHIQIAVEKIGSLRITGSFGSDRIDQMLANLD